MTTVERPWKVVGTRPVRPDGVDKVTGRAVYGADVRMANLVYGRVKSSPHAHARMRSRAGRGGSELRGRHWVSRNHQIFRRRPRRCRNGSRNGSERRSTPETTL